MTIPLERLRNFQHTTPRPGQVALAVARHEAALWPSEGVTAYAEQRARLVHRLVDDSGIAVVSWGETDGPYPREVVEVVVAIVPAVITTIGAVLSTWLSRPRRSEPVEQGPKPPLDARVALPGISLRRHDGAQLVITYRDGLAKDEVRRLVETFLDGATVAPEAP